MKACVFCPNPRTNKRGEHVWDDWLNWEDGKALNMRSTVTMQGRDGVFIRDFRKRKIDETVDVVCDTCNHGWMSVLTDQSKTLINPLGRYERPTTILPRGIVTLVAFAFMKAIVIDHSQSKIPHISPAICARFRHSLLSRNPMSAIPPGLQVWLARYRRKRAMELYAYIDGLQFNTGQLRGYSLLSVTYIVGALAFQITFPKWTKHGRKRPHMPFIQQTAFGDAIATPIWPDVYAATWPPPKHIDSNSLDGFRERFCKLLTPVKRT